MRHDERGLLATDLAATTGLSPAAAELLLELATNGPTTRATLAARGRHTALASLLACGAAELAGDLVRHRPPSWRLRRVAVRGARLCVQVCGEGEALVLAPAFGAYHTLWGTPWVPERGQVGAFSRSFRTVAIDYRGTGCSDITPAPYSLDGFAADLHAVLDRLHVQRAHLVGVSLGGGVALRMALARPERVASLVLCSTNAGPIDTVTRGKAEAFLALASEHGLEWALKVYLRNPLAGATAETVDGLLAVGRRSVRTLDNFLNLYRANVFRSDLRDRLGEVRARALVVVGERDLPFFQEEAGVLARGIAGARLARVPEAGHVVWSDRCGEFNRLVLDFLGELRPRAAADRRAGARGPARRGAAAPAIVSAVGARRADRCLEA